MDTNGNTNTVNAIVERDGTFWAQNLPLAAGANQLTLTATDAAGNVTVTNITVIGSAVTLTMNAVDSSQLWQFTTQVGGNISDPTYSISVNGVPGINNGDGTWSVANAPINAGGTAVFQVQAIPPSNNGANGMARSASLNDPGSPAPLELEISVDKPDRLYVSQYTVNVTSTDNGWEQWLGGVIETWFDSYPVNYSWSDQAGGSGNNTDTVDLSYGSQTNDSTCTWQQQWPPSFWPDLVGGTQSESGSYCYDTSTNAGPPVIPWEHCEVNTPTHTSYDPACGILESGYDDTTYTRKAQTTMKFDTGGKAVPGVQTLYLFTCSAADMLSPNPIRPETISIGGLGNLDTNGNLWVVLPGGDPDVTPKVPGRKYITFGPNRQPYKLVHLTDCTAAANPDDTRTTIGIGESVVLSGMPGITKWNLKGGGSIGATNGGNTTFTASMSPIDGTVTATVANAEPISIPFTVVAPAGIGNVSDLQDVGLGALGQSEIGADTKFKFDLLPTTVNFGNMQMREHFLLSSVRKWPNLDMSQQPAQDIVFPVRGNCLSYDGDEISDGPVPIGRLFNGTNYVDFSYSRDWTDQYLDASGNWVTFANLEVITSFRGTDQQCQEKYQGKPGLSQGPWQ